MEQTGRGRGSLLQKFSTTTHAEASPVEKNFKCDFHFKSMPVPRPPPPKLRNRPKRLVQQAGIVNDKNSSDVAVQMKHENLTSTSEATQSTNQSVPEHMNLKEKEAQLLSESLHMDQAGLKQFPILGPNDQQIKLLSLQHNFISRLQNLVSLNHLMVLDLYSNRIDRISGLQAFHSLRVLLLGKNR